MLETLSGWQIGALTVTILLFFGAVVARCEHKPDNTKGYVVLNYKTYDQDLSEYEILEPGFFGDRAFIVDSTHKFSVGDTLFFNKH